MHKLNNLEKSICNYRLLTAFIKKIFAGFQGTFIRDKSIYIYIFFVFFMKGL